MLKLIFYDGLPPYNKKEQGEFQLVLEPNTNGYAMLCSDLRKDGNIDGYTVLVAIKGI